MSNVSAPPPESLPSPRSLRRATVIALVIAVVLVLVVILPAERGIDPTGIGKIIGLKELGEFKVQTAKRLEADSIMVAKWTADSIAGRISFPSAPGDSLAKRDSGQTTKSKAPAPGPPAR